MKNKLLLLLVLMAFSTKAQKITMDNLYHKIFLTLPKNWYQVPNNEIYFMPDDENISELTNVKIIGNDFSNAPILNDEIEVIHKNVEKNDNGTKIEILNLKFKNIKKNNFLTGKYKTLKYTYTDGLKECILFIECKSALVEVVFSAEDDEKYKSHFNEFITIAKSIKIEPKKRSTK